MIPSPLPYIRTISVAVAGAVLTWAVTRIPEVQNIINLLAGLGISKDLIISTLSGVLIVAYYAAAKELGKKWPNVERWMLNGGTTTATFGAVVRRKKLGAIVERPADPRNLDFGSMFVLPVTPAGVVGTKNKPVGMLANDSIGDCVIAAWMHAIIITKKTAKFTTKLAIKLYSAITGYVPGDPNTDQGTDPAVAAKYWQKNGIVDAKGVRHNLIAYSTIKVGDFAALRAALNLVVEGVAVAVSLNLPESAQDQFASKQWTYVPGSPIEGGHEVLACNDNETTTGLGTWGSEVQATREFMEKFSTLWLVLITDAAPLSLQAQAQAALKALRAA